MPIEKPVSPKLFRRIIELDGYLLAKEDDLNWALFKEGSIHPVIIPHDLDLVPVDVMSSILDQVKMPPGVYAAHLVQAQTEESANRRTPA